MSWDAIADDSPRDTHMASRASSSADIIACALQVARANSDGRLADLAEGLRLVPGEASQALRRSLLLLHDGCCRVSKEGLQVFRNPLESFDTCSISQHVFRTTQALLIRGRSSSFGLTPLSTSKPKARL